MVIPMVTPMVSSLRIDYVLASIKICLGWLTDMFEIGHGYDDLNNNGIYDDETEDQNGV